MRLTKQTGYAIRILIECALVGNELVKVAPLAERLDITRQNAFKIVHLLSRAGYLSSVRGPSGGIRLSRPASEIRLGDIVGAMEETSVEIAGEGGPIAGGGPLNNLFGDALSAFISVLDAHTLADLAATHRRAYQVPKKAKKVARRG